MGGYITDVEGSPGPFPNIKALVQSPIFVHNCIKSTIRSDRYVDRHS